MAVEMSAIKISEKDKMAVENAIDHIIKNYSKILIYPYGNIGKYAEMYFH